MNDYAVEVVWYPIGDVSDADLYADDTEEELARLRCLPNDADLGDST